jgi:hypothetical protein
LIISFSLISKYLFDGKGRGGGRGIERLRERKLWGLAYSWAV